MDINIAFFNTQSDSSIGTFQALESKQDFLSIFDKQIDFSKEQATFTEQIKSNTNTEDNDSFDEITRNSEKNILSLGNEFPHEKDLTKNLQINISEAPEKKDNPELIYGVMFNPYIYQLNDEVLNASYLDTENVTQLLSENGLQYQENISLQFKDEKSTSYLTQEKNEAPEISTRRSFSEIENNFKISHEYKNIKVNEFISPENNTKDSVLTSLIPSDFSLEGKSKNKIQSQLSTYEVTSEFNENNTIENDHLDMGSTVNSLDAEINYDPNKTQLFEKELGEHLVSMIKENDHQVKLKINPPELGNIDIDLNLTDEQADVSFYTGNMQVMATIEASIADLKNLFNEQNLSLGDVHVFHQASDENKKHHHHFDEMHKYENKEPNTVKKSTTGIINKPSSSGNISVFV